MNELQDASDSDSMFGTFESAYERRRRETIAYNNRVMAELGLGAD